MIKPLGDVVVLKPLAAQVQERGGLIIPEQAKDKPNEAIVVAIGDTTEIKTGDRVLYGKYAGTEVKLEGNDYLIIHMADILAVLED